jgi:hypothetical protein
MTHTVMPIVRELMLYRVTNLPAEHWSGASERERSVEWTVSGNGAASGPFMALKKFINYAAKRGL